ncbi:hypothetical protein ACRAWF_00585, partial [Streptomyces sp. L7]
MIVTLRGHDGSLRAIGPTGRLSGGIPVRVSTRRRQPADALADTSDRTPTRRRPQRPVRGHCRRIDAGEAVTAVAA